MHKYLLIFTLAGMIVFISGIFLFVFKKEGTLTLDSIPAFVRYGGRELMMLGILMFVVGYFADREMRAKNDKIKKDL